MSKRGQSIQHTTQNEALHVPATLLHDQRISIGHEQRSSLRVVKTVTIQAIKNNQTKATLGYNMVFEIIIQEPTGRVSVFIFFWCFSHG